MCLILIKLVGKVERREWSDRFVLKVVNSVILVGVGVSEFSGEEKGDKCR